MGQLKKIALKLHQVSGSVLSLMFFIWFLSGMVLIYAGFPHASREDRFLHLKPFSQSDFENIKSLPDTITCSFDLEKQGNKPVYRVFTGEKAQQVYDAQSLACIRSFPEESCLQIAESFTGTRVIKTVKLNELDQWMPWNYYQPLLPIFKFYMNDPLHTVIYISSKTGSIVQQTDRKGRWAARVGAIPHWIYFRSLRLKAQLWNQVVIWLAGIGVFVSLSGLIAGMIRLRKQSQWGKTGSITSYKKFWYKWHHLAGFFFGLFVFTFVLSGLFSVIDLPLCLTPVNKDFSPQKEWEKSQGSPAGSGHSLKELWQALEKKEGMRKLSWETSMGYSAWYVYSDEYQNPDVYVVTSDSVFKHKEYSLEEIAGRAEQLFKGSIYSATTQTDYDNYYQKSGMSNHPLPVYRIEWKNDDQNLIYIDPVTGKVVDTFNKNSKIHRWLYQGLHKFDFQFLKEHEWLRKTLLIFLSFGGLAVSFTGMALGWKRIRRSLKFKNKIIS
ncbi:MAG: PepSY domain-containing protein [Mangrovibacterium sp.]